jgi:hypothetical protein
MSNSINAGYSLATDRLATGVCTAIATVATISTISADGDVNSAAHSNFAAYGCSDVRASKCRATGSAEATIAAISANSISAQSRAALAEVQINPAVAHVYSPIKAYSSSGTFSRLCFSARTASCVAAIATLATRAGNIDADTKADAIFTAYCAADDSIAMNIGAAASIPTIACGTTYSLATCGRPTPCRVRGDIAPCQDDIATIAEDTAKAFLANGVASQAIGTGSACTA